MMVLDTNAWLWWLHDPSNLSKKAKPAVERETSRGQCRVCVISVWEVALKVQLGKLHLPLDVDRWFELARSYPGITIDSLDARDAIASTRLPGDFHRDPADRFIVAFARRLGASLVTSDGRIRAYPHVQTIW
jgi:PIN domain nuclease of toxin-antitoxin system